MRHYCDECGGRVFPFDKYESLTEDNRPGKRGGKVLLYSNNTRDPEHRQAWCFSCNRMVVAKRLSESEFLKLYINRRGVTLRSRPSKKHGRRKAKAVG